MKSPFSELLPFDGETDRLNVVIETPKGVRYKYSYDPEHCVFKLRKTLPLGLVFPFDFGFVPSTQADDGDPLDILVLMEEPSFCGCLVVTRLVGVVEAEETQGGETFRNDRLIGVAEMQQPEVHTLADLNPATLAQIEHFFISYNQMEGKKFKPLRRSGPDAARELVEQHIAETVG
ncbi:MAG: Inorganic diphosphatase [Pedosphaera sp.]|nr:Inorganic diphosphatase [Pedosphaera sp.]